MKASGLILFLLLISYSIFAQNITGDWNGSLKVQGIQLRLVFHITKTDAGFGGTMDSPDQGAFGIPVSSVSFANQAFKVDMSNLKAEYQGTLDKGDSIVGTFKQAGMSFPMNLIRKTIGKEKVNRPQEPSKPYPYYSEDITFENKKDRIVLAGTLTLPAKEGFFPAVVLITGSGP